VTLELITQVKKLSRVVRKHAPHGSNNGIMEEVVMRFLWLATRCLHSRHGARCAFSIVVVVGLLHQQPSAEEHVMAICDRL
jgi:hypothetical protein